MICWGCKTVIGLTGYQLFAVVFVLSIIIAFVLRIVGIKQELREKEK